MEDSQARFQPASGIAPFMKEAKKVTIIEARKQGTLGYLKETLSYRNLYGFLFVNIMRRRFKETILGWAWLVLRPLIPAITTCIVFGMVVSMPSDDVPYVLFYFSGLLLWSLFSAIVSFCPRALPRSRGIMRKMYFPRILIPLASIGLPLIEFFVVAACFVLIVLYYGVFQGIWYVAIGPRLLLLPCLFLLTMVLSLAVAMVAGVLSMVARDVIYTLPYLLQVWMLCTPVIYSLDFVPEHLRWLVFACNPMATIVEGTKWSLFGIGSFQPVYLIPTAATIVVVLWLAFRFFCRAEDLMMDEI